MSSRELRVRIEASVQGFMAGIAKAQAGISQFDDALQRNAAQRQAIDDLGSSFGKMGLIAAGGVVLATKAAMDWESAWAGVTKTVDGSASQLATLEQQLRDMATSMPATHQEIAAVAQAAGALGVETGSVSEFTRQMIMLSEATDDLDAQTAATSIAQFMNVLQTAPDEVDNVANANGLGQLSVLTPVGTTMFAATDAVMIIQPSANSSMGARRRRRRGREGRRRGRLGPVAALRFPRIRSRPHRTWRRHRHCRAGGRAP